jgi:uncharacterized protein YjbI with pentapeptide repeats
MKRASYTPPRPPVLPGELEPAEVGAPALTHDERVARVSVDGADWPGVAARGALLGEVRLSGVRMSAADVESLSVRDAVLSGCDMANIRGRGASFVRVSISASRLTGADLGEVELHDVVLRECRLDLAGFRFARLARVAFEDCEMAGADFGGATLESVSFERCGLDGVDVSGARFSTCRMRGCSLDGMRGVSELRGVAMPWPDLVQNAGAFAAAVGVSVLDEEE